MRQMFKSGGLTLIELLIATTLFSVVVLSLYSAFHTGVLVYKKVNLSSDGLKKAQIFFNRFEVDLKNAFIYASDNSGFVGDRQGCCFFTSRDFYNDQAQRVCDVCVIDYRSGVLGLVLSCCRGLSSLENGECRQEKILTFSRGEVIFHYAGAFDKDAGIFLWQDTWSSAQDSGQEKKNFPLAVKVELSLSKGEGGSDSIAIEKTVILPSRVSTF